MALKKVALGLNRAELEHADRILVRRKLGVFFGRDADDNADAEKAVPNPVETAQQPAPAVVEAAQEEPGPAVA